METPCGVLGVLVVLFNDIMVEPVYSRSNKTVLVIEVSLYQEVLYMSLISESILAGLTVIHTFNKATNGIVHIKT